MVAVGEDRDAPDETCGSHVAPHKLRRLLMIVAALLLLGLVLLPACSLGDRAFYYPDSHIYTTPDADGLDYEQVRFESEDGTELTGWFISAEGRPQGTVVHFHGNAQNMTAHYSFVSWLPRNGFNLFVFDYRGYGASGGRPSHRGVLEDSVAALRYVLERPDVGRERVIGLGQSLGGANAIMATAREEFDGIAGVIAESAFASHEQVAKDHVIWPLKPLAGLLVSDRYRPLDAVDRISPVPLLLIHGRADRVVPYHHSERLLKAAGEPKDLWPLPGGHTAAFITGDQETRQRVLKRMREWVGDGPGG
jgi:hypothetical protein